MVERQWGYCPSYSSQCQLANVTTASEARQFPFPLPSQWADDSYASLSRLQAPSPPPHSLPASIHLSWERLRHIFNCLILRLEWWACSLCPVQLSRYGTAARRVVASFKCRRRRRRRRVRRDKRCLCRRRPFGILKLSPKSRQQSIPGTPSRSTCSTPPRLASGFIWAYFRVPPSEGRVVSQRSRQIMGQYFRLMLMFSQKFSHCARNPPTTPTPSLSESLYPHRMAPTNERLEAKSVKLLSWRYFSMRFAGFAFASSTLVGVKWAATLCSSCCCCSLCSLPWVFFICWQRWQFRVVVPQVLLNVSERRNEQNGARKASRMN